MPDAYQNFAALRRHEFEWIDFRVVVEDRHSPVAIVAPHGGKIEPGTSQIATAIAGNDYSLYCFEGIKRTGNARLHVTSSNFDEHRCLALIATCPIVVTVHGCTGADPATLLGGLDHTLAAAIADALTQAGFTARPAPTRLAGHEPQQHLQPRLKTPRRPTRAHPRAPRRTDRANRQTRKS